MKFHIKNSRVTFSRRIAAAAVLIAIIALFAVLWSAGAGKIDLSRYLGLCEFQRTFGMPCVTCYITRSAIEFARGDIVESFYIQPAGAILCCGLVLVATIAFLIAVCGVDFAFLHRPVSLRVVKYFIVSVIIILAAAWAVTIARTLAENTRP